MKTALAILMILLVGYKSSVAQSESLIFYRIEILQHTRQQVMNKIWPGVGDPAYNIPFIYFTDNDCYVVNPGQRFVEQYEPELKYQNDGVIIFKMRERMDSVPFHMETAPLGSAHQISYVVPFVKISGPEETRRKMRTVNMEVWSGMVLRELFHGYQLYHPGFYKHSLESNVLAVGFKDTLQEYYRNYDWYKKEVDEENDIILQAIDESDRKTRDSLVVKMLSIRDRRRLKLNTQLNRSIDFNEKYFETTEGTARYVESQMCDHFYKINMSARMKIMDTIRVETVAYNGDAPANYKTELSNCYLDAIGYNLARLLDKMSIEYKKRLFREPQLTLEDILRRQYAAAD